MRVKVNTTKKKKVEEKNTPKKTFKLLLRTLFKNDAVVEAKNTPWYIAALLFFLSITLSVIPPVVGAATEKGSYIINNETYQMDVGLEAFSKFIYSNNINFEVKNVEVEEKDANGIVISKVMKNQLTLTDISLSNWNSRTKTIEDTQTQSTIHYYEYVMINSNNVEIPKLRVFYVGGDYDINGYSAAYRFFMDNSIFGITHKEENKTVKPASMVVLGTHEIFMAVYSSAAKANSEYSGNSFRGDYSRMDASKGIKLHTLLLNENASDADIEGANNFTLDKKSEAWADTITESKWVGFLNEAYSITRMNNTLMMFSLIGGINAIIIIVFGFTLWILTRGKRNPNNTIKLGETLTMSCISSVSPAILSLVVGFLFPSFATLSFMLFASFRLMWLSMKTLRPIEN